MSRLKRLIVETHQRSLWQALAVYIGASFGIIGVLDIFIEYLGLPRFLMWAAFLLLVTGLPVVIVISLAREELYGDEVPAEHAEEAAAEDRRLRFVTWRTAGFAFGGVLVVWGLIAAGWVVLGGTSYLLYRGAAADLIDPQDWVTVAEFDNETETPSDAIAVRDLIASDLAASGYVRVADNAAMRRSLELMQLPDTTRVDEALALQMAERFGDPCVIAGTVARLGTGYVLTARLIEASTGRVLANPRATATDSTEVIDAADRLARQIRRHLGESLVGIRQSQPLANVTTGSLEALRKYTQGARYFAGRDPARALDMAEQAIALDTAFVMAHVLRGRALHGMGVRDLRYFEDLAKVIENPDRLGRLQEWERYDLQARYYMEAGETEKAIAVYQTWREVDPWGSQIPYTNEPALWGHLRDYEQAERVARIFIDSFPDKCRKCYENLYSSQFSQGKFDEARATLEQLRERFPEYPRLPYELSRYASAQGDYEAAERHIRTYRENRTGDLERRSVTSQELADLARVRGRVREAERHLRDAMAADEERSLPGFYIEKAIELAELELFLRGDADRAVQTVDEALQRYPLDSLSPPQRPYLENDLADHEHQGLAPFFALAGRPERARALLTESETEIVPRPRRGVTEYRHRAWGLVALAEGRTQDAVAELRLSDRGLCNICALPYLGLAYDQADEPDSAIAVFERYLTTPRDYRLPLDAMFRAPTLERLGSLYERRGDSQKAIQYYGQFVELWQDADPELQPRVEAARQRIEQLAAEGSR